MKTRDRRSRVRMVVGFTAVSFTNKTDRHDITKVFLKAASTSENFMKIEIYTTIFSCKLHVRFCYFFNIKSKIKYIFFSIANS